MRFITGKSIAQKTAEDFLGGARAAVEKLSYRRNGAIELELAEQTKVDFLAAQTQP